MVIEYVPCTCMYICMYVCMYVCTCMYVCMYVCVLSVYVCMCVCLYVYIMSVLYLQGAYAPSLLPSHINMHNAHTHTHTHTHTVGPAVGRDPTPLHSAWRDLSPLGLQHWWGLGRFAKFSCCDCADSYVLSKFMLWGWASTRIVTGEEVLCSDIACSALLAFYFYIGWRHCR